MSQALSKQETRDRLEDLVRPIDFADLEKRGVLKRKGKTSWFYVLKLDELPMHVHQQATEKQQITGKENALLLKIPKLTQSRIKQVEALKQRLR